MTAFETESTPNFFSLFSLEESFNLDTKDLKLRFRELQQKYHPDQYVNDSDAEKLNAVKMSSMVNDAYQVLVHPVRRANYMLSLYGVDLQKDRTINQEILIEQMELRESLSDISDDVIAENEKESKLETLLSSTEKKFNESCERFSKLSSEAEKTDAHLETMKQELSQMLFYEKALKEIESSLEVLE